jgi:MFS family permease
MTSSNNAPLGLARPQAPPTSLARPASVRRAGAVPLTGAGLACLIAGQLLSQIDFAGVNVALHSIGTSLSASGPTLELVVAVYGVTFAVTLVLGGQLGDTFGRRTVFIVGVAGFLIASLACGLAPGAGALLGARAAQGLTAALLVPQILATIHVTATGRQAARAIGLYGSVGGLSFIVGQVLGGVLLGADVAGLGWRAIFLVNVPVCLAVLALARHVPQSRAAQPARFDVPGTALLGGTLVSLMVPAALGESLGWPWWTWALLAGVPVGAVSLWRAESRRESRGVPALVPPSLLRLPSMRTGLVVAALFFGCWSGFLFTLTLALQSGAGLSPIRTGLTFVPLGVSFFAAAARSAVLVGRIGAAKVIVLGCLVQMPGLAATASAVLAGHTGGLWFGVGLVLGGGGQGVIVAGIFRLCLADVSPALAGSASSVVSTIQQASLGLGAPLLGSVFVAVSARAGSTRDGFAAAVGTELVVMVLVTVVAGRSALRTARARTDEAVHAPEPEVNRVPAEAR